MVALLLGLYLCLCALLAWETVRAKPQSMARKPLDLRCEDNARQLYPRGPVTPGGWTDRYLSDYPNFFADLSAGSGHNALTRDPDFTRGFLKRHQDKLLFGSDCSDVPGRGPVCIGWTTIQSVRELAPSKAIERKLLYENARRVYRLSEV